MELRLTILCENSVARPGRCVGEHGFACHISTPQGNWLFDTGQGLGLVQNAAELDCDLHQLNGIVISHGHYDHAGGLLAALAITGPLTVNIHPQIFANRVWSSPFERRHIGIPFERSTAERMGAHFVENRDWHHLSDQLSLTGEIPRITPWEDGDSHLLLATADGDHPDPLLDDQALVITTTRGLVVLLGCAHAGLINTLEHIRSQYADWPLYAVIGGTHLGPATDEQFAASIRALRRLEVNKIGTSHCTGLSRSALLSREFGGNFFFAAVGSKFEI